MDQYKSISLQQRFILAIVWHRIHMRKIHHKTAKAVTVVQLHIKTQAANQNWSNEEQTGHAPDGYVRIPSVQSGSFYNFAKELVCQKKDRSGIWAVAVMGRAWGPVGVVAVRSRQEAPSAPVLQVRSHVSRGRYEGRLSANNAKSELLPLSVLIHERGVHWLNKPRTAFKRESGWKQTRTFCAKERLRKGEGSEGQIRALFLPAVLRKRKTA